jgi:hypothetical protein
MTTDQLLKILRRRWYVLIVGLTCTIAALLVFSEREKVYFAHTDAVFEAPGAPTMAGVNSGFSESLTYFAGVVERAVDGHSDFGRLSSPTATLYGIGVHQGKSVALADRGGQWVHVFDRPVLSIQVVDSSPERVAAVMAAAVSDIVSTAESMQSASGAPPNTHVTVTTTPEQPQIVSFGQTLAGKVKGVVSMAVLGFGLTATVACLVDRYALLYQRRRRGDELVGS